jgi:hypothetical protein
VLLFPAPPPSIPPKGPPTPPTSAEMLFPPEVGRCGLTDCCRGMN